MLRETMELQDNNLSKKWRYKNHNNILNKKKWKYKNDNYFQQIKDKEKKLKIN